MSDYKTRICVADDFERAFRLAQPLLKLQVICLKADMKLTDGIANDTVAALLQARDLVRAMNEAGLELYDLVRWLGEWGRQYKEEERARLEIQKLAA